MVQKRAATLGGQGDKQSAVVKQFASGFVASSAATDAEKERSRQWDRSQLLAVKDNDAQLGIYEDYAKHANTTAEGASHKRGLGCGSDQSSATAKSLRRGVAFVSAGGQSAAPPMAATAAAGVAGGLTATSAAIQSAAVSSWAQYTDPSSGLPYYLNSQTGESRWTNPSQIPAPPVPSAPAALPPGWLAATDPSSGLTYFANPSTGETSWEPPTQPPLPPLPPPPPPPPAPSSGGGFARQYSTAFPTPHATPYSNQPYAGLCSSSNAAQRADTAVGARVRVSGIPAEMPDHDVKELFVSAGLVLGVKLDRGAYSASSQPKSGTICFDSPSTAKRAIDIYNGTKMRGNTLTIELL